MPYGSKSLAAASLTKGLSHGRVSQRPTSTLASRKIPRNRCVVGFQTLAQKTWKLAQPDS